MGFHPEGCDRETAGVNRRRKLERVQEGTTHAALVFDGDACLGWCQFGAPDELPRIKSRAAYEKGATTAPDWRIACNFVGKGHRRKGVATAALAGALDLIAGQGPLALVAEVIASELARALGFLVPQLVRIELDPVLGRAEPDPEIQELILASGGLNVGIDFLPGSLAYTPSGPVQPDAELAADIVWFDALLTNVDRSAANPNLLVWHQQVWLIDHGAALYLQHGGPRPAEQATRAFPQT